MKSSISQLISFVKYLSALSLLSLSYFASAADPVSTYIHQGKAVSPWKLQVGNGLNWSIPVKNQTGETERANLTVKPAKKSTKGDSLNVKWRGREVKNQWGGNLLHDSSLTINKNKVDISSVEDLAAINFDMRVLRKPNKVTSLTLRCKYTNKCEGKIVLNKLLDQMPEDEWSPLTLPLNCFNPDGEFDFSQLTDIIISTQGKLEFDLARVDLVALPKGHKGCKK